MGGAVHFVFGYGSVLEGAVGIPDDLTEGPCRFEGDLDIGSFVVQRQRWWEDALKIAGFADGAAAESERVVDAVRRARERGAVVWVADATPEQLLCCWLAAQLDAHEPALSVARVPPSRPPRYVRLVPPDELARVSMRRLDAAEIARLAETWRAWAAPTPEPFVERARALRGDPLLGSLHLLVQRFPAAEDGLTVWERQLLRRIEAHEGEETAYTVASVLCVDDADFAGDLVLFARLRELARQGLLAQHGGGFMHQSRFMLTELGRDVLAGRRNRVDAAGFDRWIGGTHVRSDGAMWVLGEDGIMGDPSKN